MMTSDEEVVLRRLESQRNEAMLEADTLRLEQLVDEELLYGHSVGGFETKRSWIDQIETGHFDYLSIEHAIDQVRVSGDTGVLVGTLLGEVLIGGTPRSLRNRVVTVWARREGVWRFLAYLPSELPDNATKG